MSFTSSKTRDVAFVCLDVETTGLDYNSCCMLELGIVLVDQDLEVIAVESWLVEPITDLSEMNDVVRQMHTSSGLLYDLDSQETEDGEWVRPGTPTEVERMVLDWLESFGLEPGTFPMFGSSVGFDRRMLQEHMPILEAWFHYRNIDISSLKELARTWCPDTKWVPSGTKMHRVIDDCLSTLDEALFYKRNLFGIGSPVRA